MNLSIDEINLHNDWADSENIDNINEKAFFESIMAVENKYIIRIINNYSGFENKKILDVGCGLGESSIYFASKGAYVMAIDISAKMLDFVNILAEKRTLSSKISTHLLAADQKWEWQNEFDYIYCANILHHVKNRKDFLQNIHNALKDDGLCFFWEPLKYNPVINIYRYLAKNVRTKNERPLGIKDINIIKKYFINIKTKHFWILSLFIFIKYYISGIDPNKVRYWKKIYQENEIKLKWWKILEKIDRLLCQIPIIKFLSWNIVIYGRKK